MDKKHVESVLFLAKEPLSVEQISKIVKKEEEIVLRWLIELMEEFKGRGFIVRQVAGGFEMVASPDCTDATEQVAKVEYETLSRPAMHTATIFILNEQPIERSTIAKLRGVANPDYGIQGLLEQKLIEHVSEGKYKTTKEFLKYFGSNDLDELRQKVLKSMGEKTKDEQFEETEQI